MIAVSLQRFYIFVSLWTSFSFWFESAADTRVVFKDSLEFSESDRNSAAPVKYRRLCEGNFCVVRMSVRCRLPFIWSILLSSRWVSCSWVEGLWAEAVCGGKALGRTALAMPSLGCAIAWEERQTSGTATLYHQWMLTGDHLRLSLPPWRRTNHPELPSMFFRKFIAPLYRANFGCKTYIYRTYISIYDLHSYMKSTKNFEGVSTV